jgi:hypothetical protein
MKSIIIIIVIILIIIILISYIIANIGEEKIYKDIIFIHIPKAGGTSIEKTLLKLNTNKSLYMKIYARLINNIHSNAPILYKICTFNKLFYIINKLFITLYHPSYKILSKKYNLDMKYFSCVRHPQARLVSLYCYLKQDISFSNFVINLLERSHKYDYARGRKYDYARGRKYDFAYIEQTNFLTDDSNRIVVPYIKLENINTDWHKLCSKLNIPQIPILHENQTNSNKDSWQLYYDENPHLVKIVEKYYRNDFKNFSYDVYYPKKLIKI